MIKNYKWLLLAILITICIMVAGAILVDASGTTLKSLLDTKNKNLITSYLGTDGMVKLAAANEPGAKVILKFANPFSLLQDGPFNLLKLKYYTLVKTKLTVVSLEAIPEYIAGAWFMTFCGPILMGLTIVSGVIWTFLIKLRILFYNQEAIRILRLNQKELKFNEQQDSQTPAAENIHKKQQMQKMLKQIEQSVTHRRQTQNRFANDRQHNKKDMIFENLMHASAKDWVFEHVTSLKPGDRFRFRQVDWLLVRSNQVTLDKKTTYQLVVVEPIKAQLKTIIVERKV